MFKAVLTGSWSRLGATLAQSAVRFPAVMRNALRNEGEFYAQKIREGIDSQAPGGQAFKPLSPITLALRQLRGGRGSKILVETKALRNSVTMVPVNETTVFVGIPRGATGADGRNLAEVGYVHEYGAIVRSAMTRQRMAALMIDLKKAGIQPSGARGGGAGLGYIRIPARPFLEPTLKEYSGSRGAARMQARIARGMGGMLGVLGHPDLKGRDAATIPFRLSSGRAGSSGRLIGRLSKSIARRNRAGFNANRSSSKRSVLGALAHRFGYRYKKQPSSGARRARNQKPRIAGRRAGPVRGRTSRSQKSAHVKAFHQQNKQRLKALTGRRQDAHIRAFQKRNAPAKPKKIRARQADAHVTAFRRRAPKAANAHVKAFHAQRRATKKAARVSKASMKTNRSPRMNLLGRHTAKTAAPRARVSAKPNKYSLVPKKSRASTKAPRGKSPKWQTQHSQRVAAIRQMMQAAAPATKATVASIKARKAQSRGVLKSLTKQLKPTTRK